MGDHMSCESTGEFHWSDAPPPVEVEDVQLAIAKHEQQVAPQLPRRGRDFAAVLGIAVERSLGVMVTSHEAALLRRVCDDVVVMSPTPRAGDAVCPRPA
jgi:hypothetical protein